MYLAVDKIPLIRKPHTIEFASPDDETVFTSDGRQQVHVAPEYATINCTWGADVSYQDVLRELDRLRANRGIHAITVEILAGRFFTFNALMGKARPTHIGHGRTGKIVTTSFSVPFTQVDTVCQLVPFVFRLRGIISAGDARASQVMPAAGEIVAVSGAIRDLGAGAGQTRIQISNDTTDYLATRGDFVNTTPANFEMVNQVLGADLTFEGGDQIDIDVDEIPAGGLSKDARIRVWTLLYHP